MKRIILLFLILQFCLAGAFAQDASRPRVLYTFVYNEAAEGVRMPVMIGAINIAHGSLQGVQMGFYGHIGGRLDGAQFAFANQVNKGVRGAQFGFANMVGQGVDGAQFGFANLVGGGVHGAQFGFVNLAGRKVEGAQFGFVNAAGKPLRGAQFGFVNRAPVVNGVQIGFLNVADRYESGVPIGFLSIIKEGGYQALEVSADAVYPVNLSLKTGLEHFYTSVIFAFNPGASHDAVAVGGGVGSLVPLGHGPWVFNPEANFLSTLKEKSNSIVSFYPNFGYNISEKFSILAAPTLSWQFAQSGEELFGPFCSLKTFDIDSRNELYLGVRVALRYRFNW